MLGKVFDAGRHPFVRVRVASAEAGRPPAQVAVEVNGVERSVPVTLQLRSEGKRLVASGGFSLDQSDFGIVPFSVLGGALQVRDRVDVRFTIATYLLEPAPPLAAGHTPRADPTAGHEPKAQALFETSAEVLQGLETAFSDDETGSEPGMRR
jgi:YceI-like protein